MTTLKDLKPLPPSAFFEVRSSLSKFDPKKGFKKGALPSVSGLTGEGKLVTLSLFWSPQALHLEMKSHLPIEEGDTLELFIDTRDLKNSNVITKFCHLFVITPEEESGVEATRFRGEDSHPLAPSDKIRVSLDVKRSTYTAEISLPKEILYGFDPRQFKRIGLAFRFKRKNGEKQHFPLSSDHFLIEKHPALWASMELKS